MTRQHLSLAIWPATEPVAPAAPDTTTVSPALILPTSAIPIYAVSPLRPNRPSARLGGMPGGTFGGWQKGPPGIPPNLALGLLGLHGLPPYIRLAEAGKVTEGGTVVGWGAAGAPRS